MFRGAFTALVTPMQPGGLDLPALRDLVEFQIESGIDGLVPCGTTGESPTLSHAEHIQVVDEVVRSAKGRVPVIAGAGSNSSQEAIELTRAAKDSGAAATLQITPYYNKPSQEGLYGHFSSIADAVDLPQVLYNVPGRTGVDLEPQTVARLAKHPNIVGIKEATGDLYRAAQILECCGEDFVLLSGDDFTIYPLLALGGHGVISVTSNIWPDVIAQMCRAARDGEHERARALHFQQLPLCRPLFIQSNPIMIKALMAELGYCAPDIRSPLSAAGQDPKAHAAILDCIKALNLPRAKIQHRHD